MVLVFGVIFLVVLEWYGVFSMWYVVVILIFMICCGIGAVLERYWNGIGIVLNGMFSIFSVLNCMFFFFEKMIDWCVFCPFLYNIF